METKNPSETFVVHIAKVADIAVLNIQNTFYRTVVRT
jgi:hypothetical protein